MQKTKRSAFVFNTPSVVGCHGWKLAEFLAMGKAMISTPHLNVMPGLFQKDKHYLEVLNADEIANAVANLREHTEIVKRLKARAKDYYNEYLAPKEVVSRILSRLSETDILN